MKIVDLTHLITEDMPVFPGSVQPTLTKKNDYDADGYKQTEINILSHVGTHMDSPAHLYKNGKTLDQMKVSQFVGPGLVIDCSVLEPGQKISLNLVEKYGELADKADFLLFFTGWDINWGEQEYFGDFPTIDEDVIDYMHKTGKKGVGLDVVSLDPMSASELKLHKKLLERDMVIVENLKDLDKLRDKAFIFCALPMKYENSDGAQTRAIAILSE